MQVQRIGLAGPGEVGKIFAAGLKAQAAARARKSSAMTAWRERADRLLAARKNA